MEDFVLRMLEDCPGFTKGKLYPCYKVIALENQESMFLTRDDSGRFQEIPIMKFGTDEVGNFLRQEVGLPEIKEGKTTGLSG